MEAVAICGSPRENGNTEILLKRALARLEAAGIGTELVLLRENSIKPCSACGLCFRRKDKRCALDDDGFGPVFERMQAAQIILVGSPVYFGSATPETMAILDRAGYVARANDNLLSRKLGGPIVVARRAGQNFTFAQLLFWFMINDMIVPGSTYWNIAFGRAAGEVEKDEEGLKTVDRFADNLAWLSKKLS